MPTRAEGLDLRVNSPCEEDWDSMAGNEEVRFCTHCEKSVHNVSTMTRKDAMRFVRANAGGVCVRFYSDPTGRTLHANEEKLHRITRRASKAAAGAFGAVIALSSTVLAQSYGPEDKQEASALRVATPGVPERAKASLTGTVLGPNGSFVAGVDVVITNKETGEVSSTTTNADGLYRFESLAAGTYRVEFEAEGFNVSKAEKVELQPGVEQRQDSLLAIKTDEAARAEDSEEADEGASCSADATDAAKSDEPKQDPSKQEASKSGEAEAQEITELPLRPENDGRRNFTMGLIAVRVNRKTRSSGPSPTATNARRRI
jgi:hypothetical protein